MAGHISTEHTNFDAMECIRSYIRYRIPSDCVNQKRKIEEYKQKGEEMKEDKNKKRNDEETKDNKCKTA